MADLKKDSLPVVYVLLIDSADHITEKTGVVSPTYVRVSRNGGANVNLASPADYTWTEIDATNLPGLYKLTLASTVLTLTNGECVLYVKATGTDIFKKTYDVVSYTLSELVKIAKNRRKVVLNQLLIYDDDNITVLFTFNLKDATATPSMTSIFERVPVP